MRKRLKNKKGFSILEMLISLVVISFILLIFFNTIITSLRLSYQNIGRSLVREESTAVLNQITRDVRNADIVPSCSGLRCEILVDNTSVIWTICDDNDVPITRPDIQPTDYICKINDSTSQIVYSSDSKVLVNSIDFEFSTNTANGTAQNILVTIIATHQSTGLDIGEVIRQASISTRNYEL